MKVMKIILNISVSIIIILMSVQLISNKPYMMIHKDKYESHKYIEWDYDYAVSQTMRYLNGLEDDLVFPSYEGGDDTLMTERGIAHMVDVRVLYDKGRIIMATSIVLAAVSGIFLWDRKEFYKTLKRLWVFPSIFVGTITIAMLIDFQWAFRKFHEILFSNDLWLLSGLDPLIIMLPYKFFFITGITIIILTVILHALVIVLAHKKSS